ncbi:hypothetical protein IFM89_011883 [Coptis chinensis]|uniref:TF-B3 domain-containing protein n=1 Tax=Coptis chinensis TaxID=261450 RepID=A0A835LVB4_9MAGN|nr:hypothetical protein IFM89_011883 [Coptis chinensis]
MSNFEDLYYGLFYSSKTNFDTCTMQRIPKKFVCKYGKYLPDVVALKDPSDAVWHVELKNVDGDVWIRSGWQEFIEHHSICAGHFLIFKYDGKLQFYVLIFDMSGNEIDYLPKGLHNHGEKCCVPEKQGEYGTDVALLDVSSNGDDSISKRRSSKRASVTRIPVNTEEKDGVIQKASSFKSKFPFFKVSMQPSYMKGRYVPMPVSFYRRYLPEGLDRIRIQASDGRRKWLVQCFPNCGHMRLNNGVAHFMLECNVKIGDICVFELIKKKDPVLKANILRRD